MGQLFKTRDQPERVSQISRAFVYSGVTHCNSWGEDKVVEFSGDGPYSRVVQVEREVWSEVGVNRGERVGLGQVR